MAYRLNPPPGWPPVPAGFVPPPGWQPDPSWPAPPPGWQLWVPDDMAPGGPWSAGPGNAWPAAPVAPGAVPYSPYSPYAPYDSAGGPGRAPGTNGFAIAAFVFGLIGGGLLSIVFGIMALVKIGKRPQRGKGLAIAGLCLTGVWAIALVVVLVHSTQTASQRSSSTGQITKGGHLDVLSLRTGDCFQNPTGSEPASELSEVTAVACATPHNAQVISELPVSGSTYPGEAAFRAQATTGCQASLKAVVDQSKLTDSMNLLWLYPDSQAWDDGTRTISCLVVDSSKDLTSSLMK